MVLHPAHDVLCIDGIPLSPFVLTGVAFTWTFMFPTLVVQGLRTRAANIERLAHAERQAALEAQLQAIQARTNPHFFFNSINTVASYAIPDDPRLAEETLLRVADILRYALEYQDALRDAGARAGRGARLPRGAARALR